MKIGTKSLLFGAHQFIIHPFLNFLSWWKLYGFPWDIRLWFAFFLHDIGYFGKPNMAGPEGEKHIELGAKIMARLFGKKWGELCLFHSRFYCKQHGLPPSKLCFTDKYLYEFTPAWLFLFLFRLSGELKEYMDACNPQKTSTKYTNPEVFDPSPRKWYFNMRKNVLAWIRQNISKRPIQNKTKTNNVTRNVTVVFEDNQWPFCHTVLVGRASVYARCRFVIHAQILKAHIEKEVPSPDGLYPYQ